MIDEDIKNMLEKISPEPWVIKQLLEEFIEGVLEIQENLNVPIPFEKYQFCLIDSQESFLGYMCREEHVGFMDELSVMKLWNYRYHLEAKITPYEKSIHLIALRVFLKWCYQKGVLYQEIVDSLQLARDNRMYVIDLDPCAVDLLDLL